MNAELDLRDARAERLRSLARDLIEVGNALQASTSPGGAALFLDSYARAVAFPTDVVAYAEVAGTLAQARAFVDENRARLTALVGAWVALDRLEQQARRFANDEDPTDLDAWAVEALQTAHLLPWLEARVRERAERVLAAVLTYVVENPAAFVGTTYVAADRRANEYPDGTGGYVNALVSAFERSATEAVLERAGASRPASSGAQRALDRAFARVGAAAVEAAAKAVGDAERPTPVVVGEASTVVYSASAPLATKAPYRAIPLLVCRPDGSGLVVELRVSRGAGGWSWDHPLKHPAWQATRTAYRVAALAMPDRLGRYPLEEHAFEVVGAYGDVTVDGESLGLAVALLLVAFWLDRPVPDDLAATGRITWSADRGDAIRSVDHVREKLGAFASFRGWKASPRVLVPPQARQVHGVAEVPVSAIEVSTFAEALREAGLVATAGAFQPEIRTAKRSLALSALIDDIANQRVNEWRHVKGVDPWVLMADRVTLLVGTSKEPLARVAGALAYTHAGEVKSARDLLAPLERASLDPHVRLLVEMVELEDAIDDVSVCSKPADGLAERARKLVAGLDAVEPKHRHTIAGKVLGAAGWAFLHLREPAVARELFEAALAEHEPHELGRGRVYLASSLRMQNHIREAIEETDRAAEELDAHTKVWDDAYDRQCRMYLAYERARILLALGLGIHAEVESTRALHVAETMGFWPRIGVLRTLGQVRWLIGGDAASCAREIERLIDVGLVPPAMHDFARRLAAQARSAPTDHDDVY